MEHLPPVGWADVATRRDLDALEERIDLKLEARFAHVDGRFDSVFGHVDARFAQVDARFAQLAGSFEREMRLLTCRLVLALLTALSIGLAVARF